MEEDSEAVDVSTVIELSEVMGPKGRMFDLIRAASEGWDGSDAVRPFPDLSAI